MLPCHVGLWHATSAARSWASHMMELLFHHVRRNALLLENQHGLRWHRSAATSQLATNKYLRCISTPPHSPPPPSDPHSQFGEMMLIKHVCSSSELTDVCWNFGLNAWGFFCCFFFAAWLAPRTTGERLAQPQVERNGGLTSNSGSLCGLSACLPCLTGWLLFAPAAKFLPHVFIHSATGCLIHQMEHIRSELGKKNTYIAYSYVEINSFLKVS